MAMVLDHLISIHDVHQVKDVTLSWCWLRHAHRIQWPESVFSCSGAHIREALELSIMHDVTFTSK